MILDGDIGEVIKCDRCGLVHGFESSDWHVRTRYWWHLGWRRGGRQPPSNDFCHKCAVEITPVVKDLRDINELDFFIRELRKVIDVRKKNEREQYKNNG